MKIVYIAHPIGGNVEDNLASLRRIVRKINLTHADVVPFVPYYADVVSMDDSILAERNRGIKNDIEILTRPGMVDEMWLCGDKISAGMREEINIAYKMGITIDCYNEKLCAECLRVINEL